MAHVWAASYSEVLPSDAKLDYGTLRTAALVPQWLTALALVAASDALATCPRRLAERQAATLNLKVLASPWQALPFSVYVVRRSEGRDPGVDWFTEQLLAAID